MTNELAADIRNPTIITQAYAAANAYPYLKIICPWCKNSILGSDFVTHATEHEAHEAAEASANPSWLAL